MVAWSSQLFINLVGFVLNYGGLPFTGCRIMELCKFRKIRFLSIVAGEPVFPLQYFNRHIDHAPQHIEI